MNGDLTDVSAWERTWKQSSVHVRRGRFRTSHNEALAAFFDYATRSSSQPLEVLELGCAPGKKLRDMATFAPEHRYSGVDFATKALDETSRYLSAVEIDVTLHNADVRRFDPPRPYDLVVSFGLIEHFDDPLDMVAHHARLVRPGGVVGIMIPNYRHPVLARALALYSPDTLATHNLGVMSIEALEALLRGAGLVEVCSGGYGGPIAPVRRTRRGMIGIAARVATTAWNLAWRGIPRGLQPWQGFLWACARRPNL